jgi:hypothetical protein
MISKVLAAILIILTGDQMQPGSGGFFQNVKTLETLGDR